ncbi:PilZ domain-containing protein [Leisingera sp. S232]|uniref:PilZ domain-containing protein n=1 Tax=Leisingera sp. S232 TaxID=3415132 RepID=UPI003C7EC150
MRKWLATAVVLLTLTLQPDRAQASCPVHEDLSDLNRASAGFLAYLETGKSPFYVPQLNSWIRMNPPAPLKQRMRAVGIQQVEADTLKLMKQSTVLLQMLSRQGRLATQESARHMGLRDLLFRYGRMVEALPCDQIKEDGFGSKLVAINANDARQRQQIINAAVAWVSFLVLGGSILYFLDRIGIRKIRRTKRYPCAVPCVVTADGQTVRAHLVDLSRAGAKVRPNTQCEASGRVRLQFGGYTIDAQVRWKTQDYIGVKFVNDFNFMQLHRLLEEFPMEEGGIREEVRYGM